MPSGVYQHKPLSEETKRKLSLVKKGHIYSPRTLFKKGNQYRKGIKHTEETKRKIALTLTGKPSGMLGKKHSIKTKNRISLSLKGRRPWNYIDGRSKFITVRRYGDDWPMIRTCIFERDDYTCQECELRGKYMDTHHIIPFEVNQDNSLDNLIALCRSCHIKIENTYRLKLT